MTAPLRLVNQLPVAGSLLVWEAAAGPGRELAGRQTVQVESGATVPIHTGQRQGGGCRMLPPRVLLLLGLFGYAQPVYL